MSPFLLLFLCKMTHKSSCRYAVKTDGSIRSTGKSFRPRSGSRAHNHAANAAGGRTFRSHSTWAMVGGGIVDSAPGAMVRVAGCGNILTASSSRCAGRLMSCWPALTSTTIRRTMRRRTWRRCASDAICSMTPPSIASSAGGMPSALAHSVTSSWVAISATGNGPGRVAGPALPCRFARFGLYEFHNSPDWLRPSGARRAKARRCSL